MRRTLSAHRRGSRLREGVGSELALLRTINRATEAGAVGNRKRAGPEIVGVPKEIPAISALPGPLKLNVESETVHGWGADDAPSVIAEIASVVAAWLVGSVDQIVAGADDY